MMIDGLGPCCAVPRCFCFFGCLLFVHTTRHDHEGLFLPQDPHHFAALDLSVELLIPFALLLSVVVSTIRAFVIFARVHGHTVDNFHLITLALDMLSLAIAASWYSIV